MSAQHPSTEAEDEVPPEVTLEPAPEVVLAEAAPMAAEQPNSASAEGERATVDVPEAEGGTAAVESPRKEAASGWTTSESALLANG